LGQQKNLQSLNYFMLRRSVNNNSSENSSINDLSENNRTKNNSNE